MATTTQMRVRARPAHTIGTTRLAYTPDGTKLVTVGATDFARVFRTSSDGEPTTVDGLQDDSLAVDATNEFFVIGSEDGTVSMFPFDTMAFDKFLIRSTLPIRDLTISPDGKWCAVASDELVVKIVDTSDTSAVIYLRDLPKPVKHLAFDPSGKYIALSCTDGIVYIYSLLNGDPELMRKIDGLIRTVESDSEISSEVAWHPDGRAFAAATATRDIQVMSRGDWENQRTFTNGHNGDVTAIAWSPNGAMLATAGKDRKVLLWESKTQTIIATYDYANVTEIVWHPTKNLVSFTTSDGEVYIYPDFVPAEHAGLVQLGPQPAPFIHDPLTELSKNIQRPAALLQKDVPHRGGRQGSPDGVSDILGDVMDDDEDDFVVDDDGAGYALGLNGNGKRPNGDIDPFEGPITKRHYANNWEPQYHEAFQPGATPWRGNRKYLCLNLIGFVWTVDQDSHHTVTVEFYDHEFHRDFHFTDTFLYDKACLNDNGTLFSAPINGENPATIFYRPHETWTARADWRTELPKGEDVTAISLSDSFITVTTTANYVRIYTLFGIPYKVYRQKSSPTVTCASWRDYVLTMGNGPVGADGSTKLLYTIHNIKRDEICQSEDVVALPDGAILKSVFFSDNGDPCIYDSTGTLLTLLHWRTPAQAIWVPLLDTKLLSRLASGRKTETYFPVAVADNKFHCIILKGGDQYPYFPRPLLSEFDFEIPLSSIPKKASDDDEDIASEEPPNELKKLEGDYVLKSLLTAQQQDLLDSTRSSHTQRTALQRLEIEIDKTLIQMIAVECREGEERGMRALEMVSLMRDRTGRMIEAAGKVAERYGRTVLGEKIREVGELRLGNVDDEE